MQVKDWTSAGQVEGPSGSGLGPRPKPPIVGRMKSRALEDKPTGPIDPLGGPAALWAAHLLPEIGTEPLEAGIAGFDAMYNRTMVDPTNPDNMSSLQLMKPKKEMLRQSHHQKT